MKSILFHTDDGRQYRFHSVYELIWPKQTKCTVKISKIKYFSFLKNYVKYFPTVPQ